MLTLRFTAGVGVGFSGACGPPLVWRARKPLPCALRSPASLALGLERRRAPVHERRLPVLRLCPRPHWTAPPMAASCSSLFYFCALSVYVCRSDVLRSLRLNPLSSVSHRGLLDTTIVSLSFSRSKRQCQGRGRWVTDREREVEHRCRQSFCL